MNNKEALARVLELAEVGENNERTSMAGHSRSMNDVKANIDAILQVGEIYDTMED